jgi:hypothetical protein
MKFCSSAYFKCCVLWQLLVVDVAEGCETTLASTTPEEEEVASGTTEGATTSVETGSVSTEASRHGRNNVQVSTESSGFNKTHLMNLRCNVQNVWAGFFFAHTG